MPGDFPRFDLHIDFPQYSAKFERVETDKSVTIIISCPICDSEVLRRTFENVPDNQAEIAEMTKEARAVDKDTYWLHLTREHPAPGALRRIRVVIL
jgi:hypothetical protein